MGISAPFAQINSHQNLIIQFGNGTNVTSLVISTNDKSDLNVTSEINTTDISTQPQSTPPPKFSTTSVAGSESGQLTGASQSHSSHTTATAIPQTHSTTTPAAISSSECSGQCSHYPHNCENFSHKLSIVIWLIFTLFFYRNTDLKPNVIINNVSSEMMVIMNHKFRIRYSR